MGFSGIFCNCICKVLCLNPVLGKGFAQTTLLVKEENMFKTSEAFL
jgi:hypothetical protein